MSSRLFVTRVVDTAKVIKHWYAKPARSDTSIAELFSQLRDGVILMEEVEIRNLH